MTIHNGNPDLESRIELCASILNLKPHIAWDWNKSRKVSIYLAVDWYVFASIILSSIVKDTLEQMGGFMLLT